MSANGHVQVDSEAGSLYVRLSQSAVLTYPTIRLRR